MERTHNCCTKRVVRLPREHLSASPSGIHLNSSSTRQTMGAAIRGFEFTGGRDSVDQKDLHLNMLKVSTRCIQEQMTGREVLSLQVKMSGSGSCESTPWSQLQLLRWQTIKSLNHHIAVCSSSQGHCSSWDGTLAKSSTVQGPRMNLLNSSCCFRNLLKKQVKVSECPSSKSRN